MEKDRRNEQIKLKSMRKLGYNEYGAADGKTVFFTPYVAAPTRMTSETSQTTPRR